MLPNETMLVLHPSLAMQYAHFFKDSLQTPPSTFFGHFVQHLKYLLSTHLSSISGIMLQTTTVMSGKTDVSR